MPENDKRSAANVVKIKFLIMVAMADGHWDEREVELLELLAGKFGIDAAELQRARSKPELDAKELAAGLPSDNAGRIDLLRDLIGMAYADHKLHQNELRLLVRLGQVLGFEEAMVRDIVDDEE